MRKVNKEEMKMGKIRIEFKEETCIGCGTCSALCPDNWEMNYDTNKAFPKQTELDEVGCNKEAEENCPADCIKVIEE